MTLPKNEKQRLSLLQKNSCQMHENSTLAIILKYLVFLHSSIRTIKNLQQQLNTDLKTVRVALRSFSIQPASSTHNPQNP